VSPLPTKPDLTPATVSRIVDTGSLSRPKSGSNSEEEISSTTTRTPFSFFLSLCYRSNDYFINDFITSSNVSA
jgi:hypothetical protein